MFALSNRGRKIKRETRHLECPVRVRPRSSKQHRVQERFQLYLQDSENI